jgi:hypothetical protein
MDFLALRSFCIVAGAMVDDVEPDLSLDALASSASVARDLRFIWRSL